VVRYALNRDQAQGLSIRVGLTVALVATVLGVLTARYRRGALVRTLAEYAAVVLLAVFLSLPAPPAAKAKPTGDRPTLAVVTEVPGNVGDWLADRWDQAGQQTSSAPPPSDAKEAP
jgi:hypothetical protein